MVLLVLLSFGWCRWRVEQCSILSKVEVEVGVSGGYLFIFDCWSMFDLQRLSVYFGVESILYFDNLFVGRFILGCICFLRGSSWGERS